MLEVEIVVRQARQPGRVDEEPSYDQDGLVVRCGWVAKCSQIPGFVDEAKLQLEAPNKAMATMVAIGSAAHTGSAMHAEAWLLRAT